MAGWEEKKNIESLNNMGSLEFGGGFEKKRWIVLWRGV